jgi:alkanesulfonate monooxygenase
MSLQVFWTLPTQGDGRTIVAENWNRGDYSTTRTKPHPFARTGVQRDGYTYYDLLLQVARAAELSGFDGLWIPESPAGEDPLIVAGSLAREVTRLTLVPQLRAALLSAVYSTKIAVSFQRLSGGRLAWNLVTDESTEERPWTGRRWSHAEQVARTSEFLDVAKGFWLQAPFTYEGKYYEVLNGGFPPALQGETLPRIYLSGTSAESLALSAKHADVHLFPIAPLDELVGRIEELAALARAHGRNVQYGITSDLLARHTNEEAWDEARREWGAAERKTVSITPEKTSTPIPTFDKGELGNNLWSGFGLLRPGAPLGLVGSYAELAETLGEYHRAGISTFVLGAYPHLEGAFPIGEHLIPVLRKLSTAQLSVAV